MEDQKGLNSDTLKFIYNEDLYSISTAGLETSSSIQTEDKLENTTIPQQPSTQKNLAISNELVIYLKDKLDEKSETGLFLTKILQAINKSLDSVDIIDPTAINVAPDELANCNIKALLIFGINPFEIGFQDKQINKYELTAIKNYTVLYCDGLSTIQSDVNAKKALWINLKRAFNIS